MTMTTEAPATVEAAAATRTIVTLDEFKEIRRRMIDGQLTIEELREAWERLMISEESIKAELSVKTLKELAPNGSGGATKARVVASIYRNMEERLLFKSFSFSVSSGYKASHTAAARQMLAEATTEELKAWAAKRQADSATLVKSVTNPETIDEIRTFVGYKGEAALSPVAKLKWDAYQAEQSQAKRQREKEDRAKIEQVTLGDTKMTMKEGWHTKHNCKLWIVQLTDRIDGTAFRAICDKARAMGGNWSSFGPRDTHGFQFRELADAQRFISLQDGSVDRSEEVRERQDEVRENAKATLRENGEALRDRATESLHAPRLANTVKRAGQAASAEASARSDIRMAETMIRIADAMDLGAITFLKDVRSKTHLEALEKVLHDAMWKADQAANRRWDDTRGRPPTPEDIAHVLEFPWPSIHKDLLDTLLGELADKPGCVLLVERLRKRLKSCTGYQLRFDKGEEEDFEDLTQKAKWHKARYVNNLTAAKTEFGRWKIMGILDVHTLRAALREYLPLRQPGIKADPIREAERALVGVKIAGYFPTPSAVLDRIIEEAHLSPEHLVLEPSAGKGSIVEAAIAAGIPQENISCYEISHRLRTILLAKGHVIMGYDFTESEPEEKYDRVLMNPPFEDGLDMQHVVLAHQRLKPGGRLVAIMSRGPFFREDRRSQAFRAWLEAAGGTHESLPDGSFRDSDNPTGVATEIVVVDK